MWPTYAWAKADTGVSITTATANVFQDGIPPRAYLSPTPSIAGQLPIALSASYVVPSMEWPGGELR